MQYLKCNVKVKCDKLNVTDAMWQMQCGECNLINAIWQMQYDKYKLQLQCVNFMLKMQCNKCKFTNVTNLSW